MRSPQTRTSTLLWLAAGLVANAALPWALSRGARGAAQRDMDDCHEPAGGVHKTP